MTLYLPAFAALALAAVTYSDWGQMPIRDRETIHRTLPLSGPPMRVSVENLQGYIHVVATTSHQVELTAERTIRADSDSDVALAKHEVSLDISQDPGAVSARYHAPEHSGRRFYSVAYDIDLKIPSEARAFLSNINGDIALDGTNAEFQVHSVNGGVTVRNVRGAGNVEAVNGALKILFAKNPTVASSFHTVNGSIDVTMQPDLAATLRFQTVHGQMFSDFDVVAGSPSPNTDSDSGGARFVYRPGGPHTVRVGNGGPELRFETVNGSVRLHRAS